MAVFLLILLLAEGPAGGRTYHQVPLEKVATTRWTHVETCGLVTYRRKMKDGDWHLTLERGGVKLVVEIIPGLPVTLPRKGQTVKVRGITRTDRHHGWSEIHPAEWLEVVPKC